MFPPSWNTSLLYSRVRNERNNQSTSGGGGASGGSGAAASSSAANDASGSGGGGGARSSSTSSAAAQTSGGGGGGSSSSSGLGGSVAAGGGGGGSLSDRDSFSRWRERQYYGPRRWFQRDEPGWEKEATGKFEFYSIVDIFEQVTQRVSKKSQRYHKDSHR